MQQRKWNVEKFGRIIPHLNLEQQLFHEALLLVSLRPVSMLISCPLNTLTSLQHIACDPLCWDIEFKTKNKDISKIKLRELTNLSYHFLHTSLKVGPTSRSQRRDERRQKKGQRFES
jgi:hypothetical protein